MDITITTLSLNHCIYETTCARRKELLSVLPVSTPCFTPVALLLFWLLLSIVAAIVSALGVGLTVEMCFDAPCLVWMLIDDRLGWNAKVEWCRGDNTLIEWTLGSVTHVFINYSIMLFWYHHYSSTSNTNYFLARQNSYEQYDTLTHSATPAPPTHNALPQSDATGIAMTGISSISRQKSIGLMQDVCCVKIPMSGLLSVSATAIFTTWQTPLLKSRKFVCLFVSLLNV